MVCAYSPQWHVQKRELKQESHRGYQRNRVRRRSSMKWETLRWISESHCLRDRVLLGLPSPLLKFLHLARWLIQWDQEEVLSVIYKTLSQKLLGSRKGISTDSYLIEEHLFGFGGQVRCIRTLFLNIHSILRLLIRVVCLQPSLKFYQFHPKCLP